MAIGEVFLGAFLQVLFDRLASRPLLEFLSQFRGMRSKLEECEMKLQIIAAVLTDAEKKQTSNEGVKKWLDKLQHLAYDLEDVLDGFATQAMESQLIARNDHAQTSCYGKVRNLVPACFTSYRFNRDMLSQIDGINSRLDDLYKLKSALELVNISGTASSSSTSSSQRPPSTSFPSASDIIGRDEDKMRILGMVLQDDLGYSGTNSQVISIVGMGGIGKTTLIQSVYNDVSLNEKFDIKAWVCVSQEFDVSRISKAILKDITTSSSCDSLDLNQVQRQLRDHVAGKKFLIVLDDVWTDDYFLWQTLRSPFRNGAQGSVTILTTRMENVATTLGRQEYYRLNPLSDDYCWSIFKNCILEDREDDANCNVEAFYKKVVERCRGLPLAVQSLGGLLRNKKGSEWEEILDDKMWEELESNKTESVLPVLRLSYQHLPSHLKRCFSYCAIFPEDYEFEELELVLLWMAEGFVPESKDSKQMVNLGCEYFRDLLSRSFFQPSTTNNRSKYTMHDLLNSLACSISKETIFRLKHVIRPDKKPKAFEGARHFSYIVNQYDGEDKFEILKQALHLRTFLPLQNSKLYMLHHVCHTEYPTSSSTYISMAAVSNLLLKMKKLRVLSLEGYYVVTLPDSIKGLRHLRYLNLANTKVRSLPESLSSLINLQTLNLEGCSLLIKLPSKMMDLINLHYLNIKGACLINEMPVGMKQLKSLHYLSNFIIGKGRGSSLEDLKHLKSLSEELCISGLENVKDIKEVILSEMEKLKVLKLEWQYEVDNHSREEYVEKRVLDMLQPHKNIEELQIKGYGGKDFPSWIEDPSFSGMKILKLENCEKITYLPSIGLQEREHWESNQERQSVAEFCHLRKLSIVNCPKLSRNFPQHLPSMEELVIKNCSNLVVFLSDSPMLCSLDIDGCKKVVCSSPFNSKQVKSVTLSSISESEECSVQMLQNVSHLKIGKCENLMESWQRNLSLGKPLEELHNLTSLSELYINGFQDLVSFPDSFYLPNLNKLEISKCNALTALPEGVLHNSPHLEILKIYGCASLKFIAKVQLPASVKKLSVGSCDKLDCLLDYGEGVCTLSSCPSTCALYLEYLYIDNCPSLMSLFSKGSLPMALQTLIILHCPKLQSVAGRFDDNTSLQFIWISHCESLRCIPDGLQEANCLHEILISYCASLVSFAERGLPSNVSKVAIKACENLQALPNCILKHSSLQVLCIPKCPGVTSFIEEGLPINLTELQIDGNLNIYKPLIEWGLHRLTSLRELGISRCQDAVCFPDEGMSMTLPPPLTWLRFEDLPKLEYLSSGGFKNLTSLKYLWIWKCPILKSLPEEGLPSSLLDLDIRESPLLKKRCKRGKGQDWLKIAHIPCIEIDEKFVYDSEE